MPLYSDFGLYYSPHLSTTPSYYSSPFLGSSGRSPSHGLGLLPPPRIISRISPILPSIPESSSFSSSRARTALDRSPASRYIPPPPSASRYKPMRIDTADIDVSSNRYTGLSSSHALGTTPERQSTIKRGRTVVRLHTKKFKENPTLDARRKMTPGEKLMQKFLILDKAEEEAKAARRKRLEEQEMRERAEAEVARLQAMAAAKIASTTDSSTETNNTESVDSSSLGQNFPTIGGMTENAALDILLSAAEDDEPASGGEITRSGSTGTVKKRKGKDREGTVKLAKKKTKRRPSSSSTDEVQSSTDDFTSNPAGDDVLERSTLQRRNTVRFRRNSQDTEAFPEVDSIPGSRRSSIDPGSRRSSIDQILPESRRSSLDSTTGDEITLTSEKKSTVKKRKGPKNRIVVANVSIDNGPTLATETPSPKFVVDEVKVEQSASPRPVGKVFRYEVIVEDVEGEKTAPKQGKTTTPKGGPVKKKKSTTEGIKLSKPVDKSSSDSSTDIEHTSKGENKDSTCKSFQKSLVAHAEEALKQLANVKTEENNEKVKLKDNKQNLKYGESITDDNSSITNKTSKQEMSSKEANEKLESQSNKEKSALSDQKAAQNNKYSTPTGNTNQKDLCSDEKQKAQGDIDKKKETVVNNKVKLDKMKQVKRQPDPPPVMSSPPQENIAPAINFWDYLNGSSTEEKEPKKPVLPKTEPINSYIKNKSEETKPKLPDILNIKDNSLIKESDNENHMAKGVTQVKITKINKEAKDKEIMEGNKVDRKKKTSPKDNCLPKQATISAEMKMKVGTKSTSSILQQPQELVDSNVKSTFSTLITTSKDDQSTLSLKAPASGKYTISDVNSALNHAQTSAPEIICNKKEETSKSDSSMHAPGNIKLQKDNLPRNQEAGEMKASNDFEEGPVPKCKPKLQANKVVEQKNISLGKIKQASGDTETKNNGSGQLEKFSPVSDKVLISQLGISGKTVENSNGDKVSATLLGKPKEVTVKIKNKEDNKELGSKESTEERESTLLSSSDVGNNFERKIDSKNKQPDVNFTFQNEMLQQKKIETNDSVDSSDKKSMSGEGDSKQEVIETALKDKKIMPKLSPKKNKNDKAEVFPLNNSTAKNKLKNSAQKSEEDSCDQSTALSNAAPKLKPQKGRESEDNIDTSSPAKKKSVGKKDTNQKSKHELLNDAALPQKTTGAKKLVTQRSQEDYPKDESLSNKPPMEKKFLGQKSKDDMNKDKLTKQNAPLPPAVAKKFVTQNSKEESSKEATVGKKLVTQKSKEKVPMNASDKSKDDLNNDKLTVQKAPSPAAEAKKLVTQNSKEDSPKESTAGKKLVAQKSKEEVPKNASDKNKDDLNSDKLNVQKAPSALAVTKKLVGQKSKEEFPKEATTSIPGKKLVAQKSKEEVPKIAADDTKDDLNKDKLTVQKAPKSAAVTKKLMAQKSKEESPKEETSSPSDKKVVAQKSKEVLQKDESSKAQTSSVVTKKPVTQKSKEDPSKERSPTPKRLLAQKNKNDPIQVAPQTKKSSPKQSSTQSGDVTQSLSSAKLPARKTPKQKSSGTTKKVAPTAAKTTPASATESGSDADSEESSEDEGESTTPRNSSTSSSGSSGGSSSGSGSASSDSGFDSRPSSVPVSTTSESGVGAREPGSPAPAYAFSPTLDPYSEDVGLLRGTATSATGRTTPPATSLPRFRKYTVDDFQFLKLLGKGTFGKVLLAELRGTDRYYAVKCLKKDVVLEDDDVECTLIERKVLALGTKHPYLCHLFCTFQTESHLLFVMEYLNGGDLMFHIQQSGRFPEPRARFYAAEIVCGLKFLHKKGIVYRDLKLDNILLDYEGHVRIADFGMCKLQIFLDRTADTFCGTPDYMAPEIIKGLKYNQCVDWWSFGVLVFEMLVGVSPFSGCDEDELFWSICNEQPQYPRFLSREAHSLLTALLEKDALKRLGTPDSPKGDVPDHLFFRSVDWGALERRELEPPFAPRVKHPLDVQYFDTAFTAERPELTPVDASILQSMDQAQFQGFSYTNPNATD